MIKYNSISTGFVANVENIKTREEFIVSTAINPLGVYETAVFRSSGLGESIKQLFLLKPLYAVNSSTVSQAKQSHIRTSELFEQLEPEDLIRKYKTIGINGFQQILTKDAITNEDTDELKTGDKIILAGEEYAISDPTPEELEENVFGVSALEFNAIQWFKQANDFFEWSANSKTDDYGKYLIIFIWSACLSLDSIKKLYKVELDKGNLDKVNPSWFNVFLIILNSYQDGIETGERFENDLITALSQPFFYVLSDQSKEIKIKEMISDHQVKKDIYKNYKDSSWGYIKEIRQEMGTINPVFTTLALFRAAKHLSENIDFYEKHLKGKDVDFGELVEKYY